jgi:hypothetical protein
MGELTCNACIERARLGNASPVPNARSDGNTGRGSENKAPFVVAGQITETVLASLSARPFTKEAMQDPSLIDYFYQHV